MEEKKKIGNAKLLIVAFVLTVAIIFGSTYAWIRLTKTSTIENKITAGNLELVLDDTTSEGIKLVNEVPKSYKQGMTTKEYTFTLTNKNSTSSYSLSLKDLAKYTNDNNEEVTVAAENRIDDSKIRYILLKDGEESSVNKSKILTDRTIDSGTIEKGQTISYSLRVWIDSKAETDIMGKIFNAQLNIEATQYVKQTKTALCKRATKLHTEECTQTNSTYYCSGAGYTANGSKGTTTITYGNLGTKEELKSGDAFDCDVNGDGEYNQNTERFYYVTDMDDSTAVLIYYNNVSNGKPSNSIKYAYDSSGENWHGPRTAIEQLPSTSEWRNVSLTSSVRNIVTENGTKTTTGGTLPDSFSYAEKAARLLTAQEINKACGITVGNWITGELDTCNYLMENTKYSNASIGNYGYWLENPDSGYSGDAWFVYGYNRYVIDSAVSYAGDHGVRPAIEVLKSNISY